MDLNVNQNMVATILGTITNPEHITYTMYSTWSNDFITNDQVLQYNWTQYDWNVYNPGKYIVNMSPAGAVSSDNCHTSCKHCYSNSSSDCYACNSGFVLIGKECKAVTGYYLKTPGTAANTNINLKVTDIAAGYDLSSNSATTITWWMKFFGIKLTTTFSIPVIVSLNPNAFYGLDLSTKQLKFINNSANVYLDSGFNTFKGRWIPMSISNYYSNTISSYFPPMFDVTVNKVELPMETTFSMPLLGIPITQFSIGYDCVALWAEMRFYNRYIHNPFGKLMR